MRVSPPELERAFPGLHASNNNTDFPARRSHSAVHDPKTPAPTTATSTDGIGRSFARSARLVRGVLFAFGADVLEYISVRKEFFYETDGDRLGECFRIGHRHGDIHMSEIPAMEALLDAHILAVPMTAGVQPA